MNIDDYQQMYEDRGQVIEMLKRENKILKRDLVGKNVIINNLKARIEEMKGE